MGAFLLCYVAFRHKPPRRHHDSDHQGAEAQPRPEAVRRRRGFAGCQSVHRVRRSQRAGQEMCRRRKPCIKKVTPFSAALGLGCCGLVRDKGVGISLWVSSRDPPCSGSRAFQSSFAAAECEALLAIAPAVVVRPSEWPRQPLTVRAADSAPKTRGIVAVTRIKNGHAGTSSSFHTMATARFEASWPDKSSSAS